MASPHASPMYIRMDMTKQKLTWEAMSRHMTDQLHTVVFLAASEVHSEHYPRVRTKSRQRSWAIGKDVDPSCMPYT